MDIVKFIKLRPYLYHLTDKRNVEGIIRTKTILSTKLIVEASNISNKADFLKRKRFSHETVKANGFIYRIRDQRPISLLALSKCLTHNWTVGEFIEHLNKRVYFWCKLDRLLRHYNRYQYEKPIILRFHTIDILELNRDKVQYCRLNSGATRANSHLGGIAPVRGPETFLESEKYRLTPGSVVEVTVIDKCKIPDTQYFSNSPDGPWLTKYNST